MTAPSAAYRVTRALHSHASGGVGWVLAAAAAMYPPVKMLTDQSFVRALVLGDPNVRTQLIVALIVGLAGATLAYLGKGLLAAAADDTVPGVAPSAAYSPASDGDSLPSADDTVTERIPDMNEPEKEGTKLANVAGADGGVVSDGIGIATQGLTAIQAALDSMLTNASAEVPKITGDVQNFANDFVAQRAPAVVREYVLPILQGAEASAAPAIAQADKSVQGWLAVFKTDVDSALGHLERAI